MNDEMRERLSAYLDGALSESERLAVEAQLARSEELRVELEALRAVSKSIKSLPREKLPPGFMARLESRRRREAAPEEKGYWLLPPSYRPLVFAMSTAVVALVVWDRTQPTQMLDATSGWTGDAVPVVTQAKAPVSQVDLSANIGALSAGSAGSGAAADELSLAREAQPSAPAAAAPARMNALGFAGAKEGARALIGRKASAPGKPLEFAAAPPAPAATPKAQAEPATETDAPAADLGKLAKADKAESFQARSEEERSEINERLYKNFEREKKRMGIASIIEKGAEDRRQAADASLDDADGADRSVARARAALGAMRGAASRDSKRKDGPAPRLLVLRDAQALATAWEAAGLEGKAPTVEFPHQMALFLVCAPGCGIVTVEEGRKQGTVYYRDEGFENAIDRVLPVPASAKPYVIVPAPAPAE